VEKMPWRRCRGEDAVKKIPWRDAMDRCRIWMKPWTHRLQLGQIDEEEEGRIPGRVECLHSSCDYFYCVALLVRLALLFVMRRRERKDQYPDLVVDFR